MMLANKLDFGVMGDYPLIVNGAKFQETESLRTLYVSGTGYNLLGSGNAIVVPVDSPVHSLADLRGKSLSVPVGSAAWGMALAALQQAGIPTDAVELKNQSPPVGAANIAQKKIDAHADFCPWSEIMEFRGTGRKIYDGSETGAPYLHGLVVRRDFAERYPELVVAFIKAIVAAGDWVREDPVRAAESLERWTGVEKEVQYLYFSRGGYLTLDPTLKPQWQAALARDHAVLAREKAIPPLDFGAWIQDRFIRQAYAELGRDYESERARVVDPAVANAGLQPELWDAERGVVTLPSVTALLAECRGRTQSGGRVLATYVYDQGTRLKMFGHVATYVRLADGSHQAYLRRDAAERVAQREGGRVLGFQEALAELAAPAAGGGEAGGAARP
jgi:NitT/TauT family transport system substrate-binding protein